MAKNTAVYKHLLSTWKNQGKVFSHSYQRCNDAMRSSLVDCIKHGWRFQPIDFHQIAESFRPSYWWNLDQLYALACRSGNTSAAISIESYLDRMPWLWKWDKEAGSRLHVGSEFWWNGFSVSITSMESDSFIACSYLTTTSETRCDKCQRSTFVSSKRITKRFKVNREEFNELQKQWNRYRKDGIFEVSGVKTWHAEPVPSEKLKESESAWKGIFGERSHTKGYLLTSRRGTAHGTTLDDARKVLQTKSVKANIQEIASQLAHGPVPRHYRGIMVKPMDSHAAGNCSIGTADWQRRHFPNRKTVAVEEVLKADRSPNAARACAVAIIRNS